MGKIAKGPKMTAKGVAHSKKEMRHSALSGTETAEQVKYAQEHPYEGGFDYQGPHYVEQVKNKLLKKK